MESALLFFIVGLSIFAAKFLVKDRSETIRFLIFLGSGILSGGILGFFTNSSFSMLLIPWGLFALTGGLAGVIIYGADRLSFITRPGLQYIATILLGFILAAISYGFMRFYVILTKIEIQNLSTARILPLTFLLIGFLTIFGYTFPERWFKHRKEAEKIRNTKSH